MSLNEFQPRQVKKAPPARSVKESFPGGSTTKLTARIDSDLHKRLKFAALEEERTMTEIIEESLRAYFGGK